MAAIFVHVSDIHFGQERGGKVYIHDDVKRRVIEDAERVVAALPGARATGVLVTGDIAYAGKRDEYQAAAKWLDGLAAAVGCEKTDVHVVPGNHDIDWDEISQAANFLFGVIKEKGEAGLDEIISNDNDRELFYRRFAAYRPFAEGYDCSLDKDGTLVRSRRVELAPDRVLNFVGLNSALICKKKDEEGHLLLGAKQRVLPINAGEELVVLAHHPLHWLQDSEDAKRYVRNRARVFISGHEHNPRVKVEEVRAGCELMLLASGAMVPPTAEGPYNYTYNVLEFDWNAERDALAVTVHPRAWNDNDKAFDAAPEQLCGEGPTFVLGCGRQLPAGPTVDSGSEPGAAVEEWDAIEGAAAPEENVPEDYPLLLLRYFRDLLPGQRLKVLVRLGALPDDWDEPLTHSMERRIVDGLARADRLHELTSAIDEVAKINKGADGGSQ